MNDIRFSIVIPTWKRLNLLKKILFNLESQTLPKHFYEIIIVDSSNNLLQIKQEKNIRYFNVGFNNNAYKRNFGIIKSKFKNILFLDDDCFPNKNFLYKYFFLFQKLGPKSILCGSVTYSKKNLIKNNYVRLRDRTHFKENSFNKKNLLKPANIVTMNMGIKIYGNKRFFFFNNKFKNYGFEDFEYGYRMQKKNFKFIKCNPIVIHHDERSDIEYLNKFYFLGNNASWILKAVNFNAFKTSNYYKLEKALLMKFLGKNNLYRKILKLCLIFSYRLNKILNFKFLLLFKITISLFYIMGHMDKLINKKDQLSWYK